MIPVEKGRIYEVDIENLASDGRGVCRIDGYTVFAEGAVKGDRAKIKITKTKSAFGEAKLTEIITPSPDRVAPPCPAFSQCGGCRLMHMNYGAQTDFKRSSVENAMRRIGGFTDFTLDDFIAADSAERYRNKTVFALSDGRCGFFAQKTHRLIPVDDCVLGDEINRDINRAVCDYMERYDVSAYDEKTRKGCVRRVFVRVCGEIMVVICANTDSLPHERELCKAVASVSGRIKSIILNTNKKATNLILGDKNRVLYGTDTINASLCGLNFKISADSFFQINPAQTERLYARALEYADLKGDESVLDIYCGIGTITLCAARKAKSAVGVEYVERAVLDAKKNAKLNGITNTAFYAGAAEEVVAKLIDGGARFETVILDPPRKGSDAKTLTAIVKAEPERIVYVSCNPATLARDAAFLAKNGYSLTRSSAVDMFPHTEHVETVCVLSQQKPDDVIHIDMDLTELPPTKAESAATYEEIREYVRENYGFKVTALNIAQFKRKCGIIERENYNKPKSENARQPQCSPEKEQAIKAALEHFGMG